MNPTIDHVLAQVPLAEAHLDERAHETVDILHWMHSGSGSVWIDGVHCRLESAQAVWVAAHQRRSVALDADSVMLPIPVDSGLLGPGITPGRIIDVPASWHRWLLHYVSLGMLPAVRPGHPPSALAGLLSDPVPSALPLPRDHAAQDVAQELMRRPSSARTLHEWAEWSHASPSGLRRSFVQQTGLTFQQWRRRCRMNAAAQHLADGHDIDWTAHQTGYTPNALSRAFREHFGLPPRAFARRHRELASAPPRLRPTPPPAADGPLHTRDLASPLPAAFASVRAHDYCVVYWMERGAATFGFHDRDCTVLPHEAIWVPPGTRYTMSVEEDAVVLPLGFRVDDPPASHRRVEVIPLGSTSVRTLLHTTMSTHTQIRPRDYDRASIVRVVEEHLRGRDHGPVRSDPAVDDALTVLAAAIRRDPGDPRSLAQWATNLEIDGRLLSDAFRRRFGTTFRTWRARIRMSVAGGLLRDGVPAKTVAKRVGYAHVSGFSRLFSDFHGMSPRAYRTASPGHRRP